MWEKRVEVVLSCLPQFIFTGTPFIVPDLEQVNV